MCCRHLYGNDRLLTVWLAADHAVVVAVGPHDRSSADLHTQLLNALELEVPDPGRSKPPCCDEAGPRNSPGQEVPERRRPWPLDIVHLLRRTVARSDHAEAEVSAFFDALALNWLLAGTDAHAKNYSLLLSGPDVVLAPLYDITSVLPYLTRAPQPAPTEWNPTDVKLAMTIDGEAGVQRIAGRHWRALAVAAEIDPEALTARIGELMVALPEVLAEFRRRPEIRALNSDLPETLERELNVHLGNCRVAMRGRPPRTARTR